MKRFTLASYTALLGVVVTMTSISACGSVIGIDDSRVLDPGDGGTTTSSTGPSANPSGSTGPTSTATATTDAGAPAPPLACTGTRCSEDDDHYEGHCNGKGQCQVDCDESCNKFQLQCPDGLDCLIVCNGGSCDGTSCTGGHSCTFDCTNGDCKNAFCNSPSCTFICSGDSCVKNGGGPTSGPLGDNAVACLANENVQTCAVVCGGGSTKPCDAATKGILCCAATTSCPPNSHSNCL